MEMPLEMQQEDFLLPEQKLWAAVLHRALLDACGFVGKSTGDTRRRIDEINKDAIKWFEDKHVGLQSVCEMIGLDSDEVRRCALIKIRQNHTMGLGIQAGSRRRPESQG
jgi:hypothetical protein